MVVVVMVAPASGQSPTDVATIPAVIQPPVPAPAATSFDLTQPLGAAPAATVADDVAPQSPKDKILSRLDAMAMPADDPNFVPSFGTMQTSVVFADDDIELMKISLDRIERIMAVGGEIAAPVMEVRDDQPAILAPEVAAPALPDLLFPVYHVASVVYRSPSDWMVWINGKRVTPKRNNGDVRVVRVRGDQVQLSWKPDNWQYRTQVWQNKESLSPELKKLQSRQASTYINAQTETVSALMRPNQTWVTVRPMVVEGKHLEFEVSVKPEEAELEVDANGLALTSPSFTGKLAQKYIDDIAKQTGKKINENSAKPPLEEPNQTVSTAPVVDTNAAPVASTVAAPASPVPLPIEGSQNPASLNDVLSAISNAQPPSAPAPTIPLSPVPAVGANPN